MPHEMGMQISHRVGSKIPAEGAVRPVTAGTWGSLPRFGTTKGQPDFGRTFTTRPYPCVDLDSTEVFGGPGGGIHEGKKCDLYCSGLSGAEEELWRDAFLGPGILCVNGWGG